MEAPDNQTAKAIAEAVTAAFSFGSTVLAAVILWLRGRDKKTSDEKLRVLEAKLQTLTDGYNDNVSKAQAEQLIELAFDNSACVLHCWFCRYIAAGKPVWTAGDWNLELTIHSQWNMVKGRLNVFKYEGKSLGDLVKEDSFNKLADEFDEGISTFSCTDGLSRYVNNQMNELKQEVKDKLK